MPNFSGFEWFQRVRETALTCISHNRPNSGETVEPLFPRRVGLTLRSVANQEKVMPETKSKRGFAAMDPAKQREIASKGGKASHGGGRRANSSR
jgi:hypothetical protein